MCEHLPSAPEGVGGAEAVLGQGAAGEGLCIQLMLFLPWNHRVIEVGKDIQGYLVQSLTKSLHSH